MYVAIYVRFLVMKRTTIYLDADLDARLKLESARQRRPMAELIRDAIRDKLDSSAPTMSPHAGRFASGRGDVSARAEEILEETDFGLD